MKCGMAKMSKLLRCAAIQMVSADSIEVNLQHASKVVEESVSAGAKLVVLPENFAVFSANQYQQVGLSEADSYGPIRCFLSALSRRYNIWLVAGSIPCAQESESGLSPSPKMFTSCFVYGPDGQQVARYDKLHLFDVDVGDAQGCYKESDQFIHGDKPVFTAIDNIKTGLSICYDLRFPELYRYYLQNQCQLFVVPAAFTYKTGKAHWLSLLKARAIENNAYVIAANQGGIHSSTRVTYGHSCVISPWGEVMSLWESGEGFAIADLDFGILEKQRAAFPVQDHQRLFVSDNCFSKALK